MTGRQTNGQGKPWKDRPTGRLTCGAGCEASQRQRSLRQYLDGRGEEGRGLIHSFLFPVRRCGQLVPSPSPQPSPDSPWWPFPPLPKPHLPYSSGVPSASPPSSRPPRIASSLSCPLPIPKLFLSRPLPSGPTFAALTTVLCSLAPLYLSIDVIVIVIDYSVTSVVPSALVLCSGYIIYSRTVLLMCPRQEKRQTPRGRKCYFG